MHGDEKVGGRRGNALRAARRGVVLVAALSVPACGVGGAGDPSDGTSTGDVRRADGSAGDAHPADASIDAGQADATSTDATTTDAHLADAGAADATTADALVADATTTDGAAPGTTTCWPFDQPPLAQLRASSHKVFAHYFSAYPISLDNAPAATDYYTRNYLDPAGEGGAHAFCGGLLRERPLPQTPWPSGADWEELNMETEVRRAAALGLDGFTYDVLNPNPGSPHRTRLDKLLVAAARVDPGFKIQLVLDMTTSSLGGGGGTDDTAFNGIATLFTGVGSNPALQRLADGRIVVSAFAAEQRSAAFWQSALSRLDAMGYHVAFVPMPVGGWPSNASHFAGVPLYGASSWGVGTVSGAAALQTVPAQAHGQGLVWMAPVRPQDSRPKELDYIESNNSAAFRAQWDAAIAGGADWVQLITWNDYSEDSEVAPSSQTHAGFYDLAAYYTTWFKTGAQPPIARDALYYFHRTQSMDATPDLTRQRSAFRAVNGPTTAANEIELVALLTAPGTLQITIGGQTHSQDAPAGIQSFRVPLVEGTPAFRLVRGGATVVSLASASPISNAIVYQDPLYHAGSSTSCAR